MKPARSRFGLTLAEVVAGSMTTWTRLIEAQNAAVGDVTGGEDC